MSRSSLPTSTQCHHKQYTQVYYVNWPLRPRPDPKPTQKCITCSGNQLRNGQFDTWINDYTPEYWKGTNLVISSCSHIGVAALQMGILRHCDNDVSELPSSLFQTISVCPKQLLVIQFYLALLVKHHVPERHDRYCDIGNPFVESKLVWLDWAECEIGVGACLSVLPNSIGLGWFSYQTISSPVPENAKTAKLVFTKDRGFPVLLDSVCITIL